MAERTSRRTSPVGEGESPREAAFPNSRFGHNIGQASQPTSGQDSASRKMIAEEEPMTFNPNRHLYEARNQNKATGPGTGSGSGSGSCSASKAAKRSSSTAAGAPGAPEKAPKSAKPSSGAAAVAGAAESKVAKPSSAAGAAATQVPTQRQRQRLHDVVDLAADHRGRRRLAHPGILPWPGRAPRPEGGA